jgi:hypothetical protein
MVVVTKSSTKLRPNNHYLDIIAKIHSNGGKIFDLSVKELDDTVLVRFCHTYTMCQTTFSEKLIYNFDKEIIYWAITINNNEVITLYSEE